MNNISIRELIATRYPTFFDGKPDFIKSFVFTLIEKILHQKEINRFLQEYGYLTGMSFIEELFDYLNFSYTISNKDIKKIPSEGRLICVANHPIGSLDSLSLLKAVYEIRPDVKIVANDILGSIENISSMLLPFDLETDKLQRKNIAAIEKVIENEQAVILFPAAEVSRLKLLTVTDAKWHKGAIYFARKFQAPILPIYVDAKNSLLFYFISVIHKDISRILLAHELFNKRNHTIQLKIGDPIPAKAFSSNYISDKVQIKLLKKHVYSIGKKKIPIYVTEKNIIHPVDRKLIKKELNNSQLLGITNDDKKIILTDLTDSPNVLSEVARLREVTFRKVGEGTGRKLDLDKFDRTYKHLIVWDESELEIVGSYRIGVGNDILEKETPTGFYTSTLFNYNNDFIEKYMSDSIELGRSFVQKKYWNTNALNYLWQGIGAFLAHHEYVKYMFGGVSISNSYPDEAKKMIVYYFQKWFSSDLNLAASKNKFEIPLKSFQEFEKLFTGANYKEDYKVLKALLKPYGYSIPILYKHYSELCYDGGVKFLDFGIDTSFENCIDGLILVDVNLIKEEKKERYIKNYMNEPFVA